MRTHQMTFLAAALTIVLPPLLLAQRLGPPVATWHRGFSRIGGVAELPDGVVVIVDNLDGIVFLGEAGGGTVRQIGRPGDGPNEYRRPWSPVRGPGDTVLVYAQNRLIRITPTGTISGSHPLSPRALGGGVGPPLSVDAQGRVYWDRPVIRDPETNAIKRQQQFQIVRFRPGTDIIDIVATAHDHAPELHEQRFHPFPQRDAWVIDPDGTVRIVRARNYSVDVVRNRRVVNSGPAIPFESIRIGADDRGAYRTARAANAPTVSFGAGTRGGSAGVTPARLAQMREAYPDGMFPEYKPPFIEDGVFRSPYGQLWVVRSPAAGALHGLRVDVLDHDGRRIHELDLPVGGKLVGLNRRGVYLVQEDDDGLQYLARYAWPTGLR